MENKNNLRRIPLENKFMVKKINDILYGYLQTISYIDKNQVRFVYKSEINFSNLERRFNGEFKRLTLTRDFKYLLACGFITEGKVINLYNKEVDAYILPYDEKSIFKLIPLETLKFLVDTTNSNVIKIYTYLLNKFGYKGSEYHFTDKELIINCLGLKSTTNQRDYDLVNNILNCLSNNELIKFTKYSVTINNKPVPKKRLLQANYYYKKPDNFEMNPF